MSKWTSNDDFQLHATANQHDTDWVIRVTLSRLEKTGMEGEPRTWRGHTTMPIFDSEIDQAWVILIAMLKLLERDGASGRVTAVLQDPLW